MDLETPEIFISKLKHDINCLSDTDRSIRKSGLDKLFKEITNGKNSKENIELLLANFLMNPLVKCLEDQIERHRETAIKLYSWLVNEIQFDKTLISILIAQIISRMDKAPFAEKCMLDLLILNYIAEELRLKLIDLLSQIIKKYTDDIKSHIPSMTKMLAALLNDQCPEIKIKLSVLISDMSIKLKENIGNHGKPILLSLCANLKHQHKKVRKITIDAIVDLLICNNVGTFINECVPFLKPLIADNHDDLRKAFYISIAKLMNNLNIVYLNQCESLLLLLLINGLSDDKEDIRSLASSLIEEAGKNRKKLAIETGEDISKYI